MQRNRGKNRMGKTRDIINNMRDIQQTFHARMGMIKDRNCEGLIKKERK